MEQTAAPVLEAPPASPPLLSVRDLEVTFTGYQGAKQAVRRVGFDVRAGEMVGLVGESGSGKTMSARAVLGLLPSGGRVTAGQITFAGTDVLAADERSIAALRGSGVAMIFQNAKASLNPCMRVGDQVGAVLMAHRGVSKAQARTAAVEYLERVGITQPAERARSYPHELSGGMCQRVAVAITLACGPRLLIADEPTTGLDVTIGTQVMNLIADLRRTEDLAVLIITHDLGMVARYCDRVVVMTDGEVVEEGPTTRIFEAPEHPYTARLLDQTIGSARFLARAAERAAGAREGEA